MANDYFKPGTSIVQISCPIHLLKVSGSGIYLPLHWITQAGFTEGIPIKVRIMPDGILITTQNIQELKECLEGMSSVDVDNQQMEQWLYHYPGELVMG